MERQRYDVAIIGLGSAGQATASKLKEAGKTIVCFDNGGPGNLCSREGCMPSKTLFAAAEHLYQLNKFSELTTTETRAHLKFDTLMNYVRKLTAEEFVHYVEQARQKTGFIRGQASIQSAHMVECEGTLYDVEQIIVATGSRPRIPAIEGLDGTPYWTSREVFQLTSEKVHGRSLAVLGGGVIACEMAQCFSKLGFAVTIYTRSGQILREFDPRQTQELKAIFEQSFDIKFLQGLPSNIRYDSETFHFSDGETYAHVLVASGREAVLPQGLEELITLNNGKVQRQENLQTSSPNIYAVGDCAGIQLLHESGLEGEHAAQQILTSEPSPYQTSYLSMAFTYPHLAQVGVKGAFEGYADFDFGRATIEREDEGSIYVHASAEGIITGGSILHDKADYLIHIIQEMIGKHVSQVGPFFHPTVPEGIENALSDLMEKLP